MKGRNEKRFQNVCQQFVRVLLFIIALIFSGCGGGGGGGDDNVVEVFDGGSGTGADSAVTFWRYLGGDSSSSVEISADGGYAAAGTEASALFEDNGWDCFVVKTDADGVEQWRMTPVEPDHQALNDIKQADDGGFIAVGNTGSGSGRDVFVIKTDATGNLEWSKTYDAGASGSDEAHGVCKIPGGYAIAGSGQHFLTGTDLPLLADDIWFFKIDLNGNKIESSDRFLSFAGWSRAYAMKKTRDSGFILAGIAPQDSVLLARLDENGDEIWSGRYGTGIAYSICQLPNPDNGFIAAGSSASQFMMETSDVLVVKVDESGNELWHKVFGGPDMDIGYGVTAIGDRSCLIAGVARSFSADSQPWNRNDIYLIKLDWEGNSIWQKVKGLSPDNSEEPYDVASTSDGGFIITGCAQTNSMLAKFDKNGNTILLGDRDFTYTVTETSGLINMGNAQKIAAAAADLISVPLEVGSFPLDIFIDTLNGIPVGDLCDSGGNYKWNHAPELPVAANDEYLITFTGCQNAPGVMEQFTYNGSIKLTVSHLTGEITGDDYDIRVVIDPINVIVTDDVGDSIFSGGLVFSRISAAGNFAERVETDGTNLNIEDDAGKQTITQIDFNSTRHMKGRFSIGNPGQYGIIDTDLISGPLKLTIQTAISGTETDEPEAGKLRVEAQDGSSLIMTVTSGDVVIEIDTDNDGSIDGTLASKWIDMD